MASGVAMSLWLWCLGLMLGLSLKNLHFMWYIRFFSALAMGYLSRRRSGRALKQHHIFFPSNSTYITDLDVSRAYLSGLLFAPTLLNYRDSIRCNFIVGAIACIFHREIKPYQPYEVWTKVSSWDDKWIYMVSHFVDSSKGLPRRYVMQRGGSIKSKKMERPEPSDNEGHGNDVFASAVTRMVFKRGRLTVPPRRGLEICGILSTESPTPLSHTATRVEAAESAIHCHECTHEKIELSRRANLSIVRLERGWDAVRGLFRQEKFALTEYNDFMW